MDNVEKMVAAKLLEREGLSQEEKDLINSLSHHEINAIISAGEKFLKREEAGARGIRVAF